MEIAASARKWGVADEDMRHAIDHALKVIDQDDRGVLFIGGSRSGDLLEVVVVDGNRIIHAMPLRPKFYDYL